GLLWTAEPPSGHAHSFQAQDYRSIRQAQTTKWGWKGECQLMARMLLKLMYNPAFVARRRDSRKCGPPLGGRVSGKSFSTIQLEQRATLKSVPVFAKCRLPFGCGPHA